MESFKHLLVPLVFFTLRLRSLQYLKLVVSEVPLELALDRVNRPSLTVSGLVRLDDLGFGRRYRDRYRAPANGLRISASAVPGQSRVVVMQRD